MYACVSLAGQWWHCWSLWRQATDLHVGEGAACFAAALWIWWARWDDVFQPVQGDDEEGEEKEQQAEEDGKIDVDTFSADGWSHSSPSGESRWVKMQKALSFQLSPIQLLYLAIHPRQMLTETCGGCKAFSGQGFILSFLYKFILTFAYTYSISNNFFYIKLM